MGKAKKKIVYESFQTGRPTGNFMMLYWDMLDSKAWQELTGNEIQLYLYMLRKYQRKNSNGIIYETNSENISAPENTTKGNTGYSEFMNKRMFWKCIDHLIELGFVKLVENRYATRQANIYGFNDMWQKYGTKEFYIKSEWLRTDNQRIKAKCK